MTTSFDTPRVFGHHNPFASFSDTTDDPLASSSAGVGVSGSGSGSGFGTSAGNSSADPWSSYYNPPVASTSSSHQPNGSSSSSLSNVIDEETIPHVYTQAWHAASSSSTTTGPAAFGSTFNNTNTISLVMLQRVLSTAAGLGAGETEKIINLVSNTAGNLAGSYATLGSPTSPYRGNAGGATSGRISKLEFYIALALAALAQQKEALSIQAVSTRRHSLPIPTLDLSSISSTTSTLTRRPSNARNPSSPTTPYRNHKVSLGSQQSDPWSAPTSSAGPSQTNGDPSTGSDDPFVASPSRYSIGSTQPPMYSPPRERGGTAQHRGTDNNGYSSFPTYNDEGGLMEESSSAPHNESSNSTLLSLPPFISSSALSASQEKIKIIQMEELQGNFLTRYTVYKVYCEKRASEVMRRYSDWNWLESYLDVKYPARIRLNLPPKRMGISSRHVTIASDEQFLERRRRGLTRYLTLVANHPILKHDKAVKAFLTETMDFSTWRKIHHEELQISEHNKNDEASLIGKLSNSQESLIPTTIETIVQTLRESLPELIEGLTRFCSLIERINYRNEMNANDFIRCKLSFDSFGEIYKGLSNSSSGGSSNYSGRSRELDEEILYLNKDLKRFSDEALGKVGERMEIQYRENESELLEGKLKMQRDIWRALFGLLNRYENKLKHDDVEKLKKKIESKQARYTTLQSKRRNNLQAQAQQHESVNANTGGGTTSKEEEEMKRILQEITSYQDDISRLLDRRAFFKWALMAEIRYTWRMSSLIRVDLSDWIGMESRYYADLSRVWRGLEEGLSLE